MRTLLDFYQDFTPNTQEVIEKYQDLMNLALAEHPNSAVDIIGINNDFAPSFAVYGECSLDLLDDINLLFEEMENECRNINID